ncbi:MAG: FAD-binding protein [Phycisphaerae bacterium]|nr:FAD-binding protein [Phycisphaerae bacterium]
MVAEQTIPEQTYNPVTPAIVEELKNIVGARYVIHGDEEKLEPFSHDEILEKAYRHMPDVVARPRTAQEIAAIMKLANREHIAVTPRGAGSGLSGGAVPIYGGVVLLCDRMNDILDVDAENMMIVVEPGVVTSQINEHVAPLGLFYAGYPMSLETCYIGGNVAENAGGGKAVKYGVTSRYVLGLEVVTPTGEIIELGGKLVKDVTGYNLLSLMTGSEGTLGIFTKIILKLLPSPKANVDLLCLFPSARQAIEAVPKIMTQSGITPTAIEFMDRSSVKAGCEYLNETIPYQNAGACLLITVDGASEQQVEREYEAIGELCLANGAFEVYVADNFTTSERIWKIRRNVAEAFAVISPIQVNEDLVVPPSRIPDLVDGMAEIGKKYNLFVPTYGHAGDGNIHSRISPRPEVSKEQWYQLVPEMLHELYTLTAGLGGRVSGEHGIGHKRKQYVPMFLTPETIEVMKTIKRALDPNNVLNPGKIFDV